MPARDELAQQQPHPPRRSAPRRHPAVRGHLKAAHLLRVVPRPQGGGGAARLHMAARRHLPRDLRPRLLCAAAADASATQAACTCSCSSVVSAAGEQNGSSSRTSGGGNSSKGGMLRFLAPRTEPAAKRPRGSVDAAKSEGTGAPPWECSRCTFFHDGADSREFLACQICGCPRSE